MTAVDRRLTCRCGHRYIDHGNRVPGGKCLAMVNDPARSALHMCYCSKWWPWDVIEPHPYADHVPTRRRR